MFPVSTVLFPHDRLPLHVFEPRYRALVTDCLAGEGRLGLVLISRGSEVGGGDERFGVGTVADIEAAEPQSDGRWHLVVRGLDPIRVLRWLDDGPYPSAVVEDVSCPPAQDGEGLRVAQRELRTVRALLSELGEATAIPAALSLGDSPDEIAWRLCALAPVNAFDRQRLLEAPGPEDRLVLLLELLRAIGEDLRRILGGG
jgi:Lon protease-like protein